MSGSGRETLPHVREVLQDVREWLGGLSEVRKWSVGLPDVREWSGDPPVCAGGSPDFREWSGGPLG